LEKRREKNKGRKQKKVAAYIFKPQIYGIFKPQILLHFKADADNQHLPKSGQN
jgi:hypothetical protein